MRYKIIAAAAGALLFIPIGWQAGGALGAIIAAHAGLLGLVAGALLLALALGGLRIVFAAGRLASARARQAELATMQNGQPIHIDDVSRYAAPLIGELLRAHAEAEKIRAGVSPALSHLHIEEHPALSPDLLSQLLGGGGAPQLAGPDATPLLVTADEWRGWMDRAPHLLIAGRTDAGKTTLATALLTERALGGDAVLVLDPHYQPGKWAGVPTIGGGNDFEAILRVLPLLLEEMDARYKDFNQGRPTEDFQRLTILIDEVPALVEACMGATPSGRPKVEDLRWLRFAKRLGSEARKVRLSVILLTQSTLVQDILINSQQRDNYLRVGLGDRAGGLLSEERNGQRKAQLQRLLVGQVHPAAMEWRGEVHLLDTHDVPALAARQLGTAAQIWMPAALPAQPAPTPAQQPATAPIAPAERVGIAAPPPPREAPETAKLPDPTVKDQIVMLLEARAGQWLTHSEIAAALAIDVKVISTEAKDLYDSGVITRRATRRNNERVEYSTNQSTNAYRAPTYAKAA